MSNHADLFRLLTTYAWHESQWASWLTSCGTG